MFGLMQSQPLLISDLLRRAAVYFEGREIISARVEGDGVQRNTYAETYQRVLKLANALRQLGIQPGDTVGTLAWNTHRHLELYFAVAGIGAICHTINPRFGIEQLRYISNHAENKLLFFDASFRALVSEVRSQLPNLQASIAMSGDAMDGLTQDDLIADHEPIETWPSFDERQASGLCYTSGTTGDPKGVLYSHRSTLLHAYAITAADVMGISNRDVVLPIVPLYHVNAWGVPYSTTMTGANLVLPGSGLDGKSIYDLMQTEGVTLALGVPTVWQGLLEHVELNNLNLDYPERIISGGAALPEDLIRRFRAHGVEVQHGYGMTEMSPVGTINNLDADCLDKEFDEQLPARLKQGRMPFGIEPRLQDDNNRPVVWDGVTPGRLQVRGPWVVSRYYKHDQDCLTDDGWFDTGDIATIDLTGCIQITDRTKDLIKSGGEWISSIAIENAALNHPDIIAAAAIPIADKKWGERPMLLLVTRNKAQLTLSTLNAFLAASLPKWWLPEKLEIIDEMPIGATGKVLKRELRERYLEAD